MKEEIILSGVIPCEDMTVQQLVNQLRKEILSRIAGPIKNKIKICFGTKLYDRLYNEELIDPDFYTIDGITCCISYRIRPYNYCVMSMKYDHEDGMDAMLSCFQAKDFLRSRFNMSRPKLNIDLSKGIKKVIFNPPATIVFWGDGSKTVVKCDGEAFDPEKGMAMAISRKVLGDSYEYYNVFEKWCKKYKQPGKRSGKYPWGTTPQEVAAKYMTPPTIPESAVEEVKRYTKIESGDLDAD